MHAYVMCLVDVHQSIKYIKIQKNFFKVLGYNINCHKNLYGIQDEIVYDTCVHEMVIFRDETEVTHSSIEDFENITLISLIWTGV